MADLTFAFNVGEYIEFRAKNGYVAHLKVVGHQDFSEGYIIRSRGESEDRTINFAEGEMDLVGTYEEPNPW